MNLPPEQEARLRRWLAGPEVDLDAEAKRIVESILTPENLEKLGGQMWQAMEPEVRRLFDALGEQLDAQEARIARLEKLVSRLGKVVLEGDA